MLNYRHPLVQNDLQFLKQASVHWELLKNKTILITGATGLIASWLSFMLIYLNEKNNYNIKLILLARNKKKLEEAFGNESLNMLYKVQDVCEKITVNSNLDYIFHAAGAASPYDIVHNPAGIAKTNTLGTLNVLEVARSANTQKVIFTSTREVYGKVEGKDLITEKDMGIIDPLDSRSCYPEGKRMAETLMKSFSLQYGIKFNTLRIAHVYGPGMQLQNDGRVMADFLKDALNKEDIQIKSNGTAVRSFCYITDAAEAFFRILIYGKNNQAYNIANESEPVTLLDLAHRIQAITKNNKSVHIISNQNPEPGYCNYKRTGLNTSKTESLGWKPKVSLSEGINRTITSFLILKTNEKH